MFGSRFKVLTDHRKDDKYRATEEGNNKRPASDFMAKSPPPEKVSKKQVELPAAKRAGSVPPNSQRAAKEGTRHVHRIPLVPLNARPNERKVASRHDRVRDGNVAATHHPTLTNADFLLSVSSYF